MDEESTTSPPRVIVAKASNDYRWRRYALVIMILGYGIWSAYDGFIHMQAVNAQDRKDHPGIETVRYPELDITLNRVFAFALPPIAVATLVWALYVSRGKYEFDGTQLKAPGHPPITINDLREIDRSKWDRKGIAFLHYELENGQQKGIIKLDDFIYQRVPTDEIFKQIESTVASMNAPAENAAELQE